MPHFPSWEHSTLARFASDAYLKMQEQAAEIERLQRENKRMQNLVDDLQKRIADDWK